MWTNIPPRARAFERTGDRTACSCPSPTHRSGPPGHRRWRCRSGFGSGSGSVAVPIFAGQGLRLGGTRICVFVVNLFLRPDSAEANLTVPLTGAGRGRRSGREPEAQNERTNCAACLCLPAARSTDGSPTGRAGMAVHVSRAKCLPLPASFATVRLIHC